jgi:hypothetical protein
MVGSSLDPAGKVETGLLLERWAFLEDKLIDGLGIEMQSISAVRRQGPTQVQTRAPWLSRNTCFFK